MLRIYNTLSARVEDFVPLNPPEVRMYVCGPTVYNRAHIGNFRTFVASDVLRRALRHLGFRVVETMNLTDVEDRIIKFAQDAGTDLRGFTAKWIEAFEEDMGRLRMERPEHFPRATDHVPEMVALVEKLSARGHTYTSEGSIYFRIASFPEYGRLSRLDVSGIKAGARVDNDRYEKEEARDFVLWKLDLHCGGVDLIFPHHENEIAQSQGGTGKLFVRHWVHVQHLLVENETMSKSKGNFFTIPDLIARGHRPEAIRYLLCQAHYRKSLNFTFEGLGHAQAALDRIHGLVRRLAEVAKDGPADEGVSGAIARARAAFDAALEDDLNTPEALAAVHNLVSDANSLLAAGGLTRAGAAELRSALVTMDQVFGVLMPAGDDQLSAAEQALFEQRQQSRKRREFQKADAARAQLEGLGIVLEDTPQGTRWRRVR
jgi:cysteinyl-tRNA synthetase